jgi:ABC-2 type transport system permease protein
VFGALLGGVAQIASNQINASPQLHSLIVRMGNNASPVDGFFALLTYLLSQVIAGYAIQATLRLRSEEVGMRADPVLATPVDRLHWASSHLFFAAIGPAIVLAALGLSMGLTYGLSSGSAGNALSGLLAASLVRLPAVWVMAGIAAALYGLLPRFAAPVTWAVLVVFLLLELAVDMKQVSPSVLNISPFAVTPGLPVAALTIAPLLWLVGISAVLTGAGLLGFRRRDIG